MDIVDSIEKLSFMEPRESHEDLDHDMRTDTEMEYHRHELDAAWDAIAIPVLESTYRSARPALEGDLARAH